MMDRMIMTAEGGVFIAKGVQAVRAGGDDAFWSDFVEQLHIGHRHLIKKELITRAPGGITGASFLRSQYSVIHASCVQDLGEGAGGFLSASIGCGSGTFLNAARSRGYVVYGMDASAPAVETARRQYGLPVRRGDIGQDVWEGLRFDFVTMFHVLEHLPDPRRGLRYAAGLLKPDGMLILQVPNVASLQARLFRSRWYGLDAPRHVINFSPRALGLLLEEMGFAFRLIRRFSLRDNPASIASSLAPGLDPVGREGRKPASNPWSGGAAAMLYFGLYLFFLPPAFIESAIGRGGTLWACARLQPIGV